MASISSQVYVQYATQRLSGDQPAKLMTEAVASGGRGGWRVGVVAGEFVCAAMAEAVGEGEAVLEGASMG